jgi:heptosyltransferase-3
MKWPHTIILSRTDSIGDVMLTLPMAGILKQHYPDARIVFLGRTYTAPVLHCCRHVDRVITLEELQQDGVALLRRTKADAIVHVFPNEQVAWKAKAAGIPHRIGTSHRWWHWLTVNERVAFSRRKSDLHETQLNTLLLRPFGISRSWTLDELADLSGFTPPAPDDQVRDLLRSDRKHVVLHPGSRGSAVEWGLDRFTRLIHLLHPAQFQVIITGTEGEAAALRAGLPMSLPHVCDAIGKLDLRQLIALIGASDALVAASTGPLHIAAACGIRAIGLYAHLRPIHPGRWAPIGKDAHALTGVVGSLDPAEQIRAIEPERVMRLIEQLA